MMMRLRAALWLLVLPLLAACADPVPRGGGDILAMGDSVMAWNGTSGRAIPDALGAALDREVVSRAVPGAQIDNASTLAGAVGFDIRRQFPGGQWNWVVMNGGANDLNADCACGACAGTVERLIAADGQTGAIPALIRRVRDQSGARVLWMGYYKGNGRGGFEGCRADLVEIEARIARLAARTDGVVFVDSEAVIDPGDPGLFAADNTHPSPRASALIGAQLAREIARAGRSQSRGPAL